MENSLFSTGFLTACFVLLFVCLMLPLFTIVYYTFKKRFNFLLLVMGVAGYFIFGFMLTNALTGIFAPSSAMESLGAANYAIRRSLCFGVVKVGGIFLVLSILKRWYVTPVTATSYAVGYTILDMLIYRGSAGYIGLSQGLAVNKYGIDEVVATADLAQQDALRANIMELAGRSPSLYLWYAADSACAFISVICIARLLWYAIEGGRLPKCKWMIPICALAAIAMEIPSALWDAGAFATYTPAGIIYYVMTALLLAGTFFAASRRDEKKLVADSRLRRRGRR